MPATTVSLDRLLVPISAAEPAGDDLRFSSEWKKLEEARRSDDELDQGAWETERKTANWQQVLELASRLLEKQSKDLRLAMFLVEAKLRTEGFRGLGDGLHLTGELLEAFWDTGLHPLPEPLPDGEQSLADRGKALLWLSDKLADVIAAVPITFAGSSAQDYSYARYQSARQVGYEKDFRDAVYEKRKFFETAKEEGRCLDLFDEAVRVSPLSSYKGLVDDLHTALRELLRLEAIVGERFGESDDTPGFSRARTTLEEIRTQADIILAAKSPRIPSVKPSTTEAARTTTATAIPPPIALGEGVMRSESLSTSADTSESWAQAQAMVLAGQEDLGLAQMVQLAQKETSGRNRFQRKLLLAEVCLKSRPRLARTILEELAEQIEKYKLDEWETTDVVGGVWTRLYRMYVESNETEKAAGLYSRLCRLDPWQTMSCSEE